VICFIRRTYMSVQLSPSTVNAVGFVLEPLWVPWNPKRTEPPGATLPLLVVLVATTAPQEEACVMMLSQKLVMRWPLAKLTRNVQPAHAVVPVLATLTVAVNPLFQLFGV
jgi:hypothetical protein